MIRRWIARLTLLLVVLNVALVANTLFWSQLSETRFPPSGEFIEVEGLRMHVLDTGAPADGDSRALPLVLIHGASSSLLDMQVALQPVLESHHRLILVDRPGHGYSERRGDAWSPPADQARQIRLALAALGIEESIWVGHSWAGSVVLAGLQGSPQAVVAGVSIAGVSHPWKGGTAWYNELADRPVIGPVFAWQYIQPGGRLSLDAAVSSVFDPEPVPEHFIEDTGVELTLRPDTFMNNAADLNRLSDYLVPRVDDYPDLKQPVLLISGTADHVVPAWNHAERLARVLPTYHWVRLQGAGHGLHHTRAATLGPLIDAFSRCVRSADPAVALSACISMQSG